MFYLEEEDFLQIALDSDSPIFKIQDLEAVLNV